MEKMIKKGRVLIKRLGRDRNLPDKIKILDIELHSGQIEFYVEVFGEPVSGAISQVQKHNRDMPTAIGSKFVRFTPFDLANFTPVDFIEEQINGPFDCSCDSLDLFNYGCKCGFLEKENAS